MIDRQNLQAFHPFTRLRSLLDNIPAGPAPRGASAPLALSIGEPKGQPPAFVAEEIAANAGEWSRYPPGRGSTVYLEACTAWLQRRYEIPAGIIDPQRHVLALPGTREGLFFATMATVPQTAETPDAPPPVVLIPNPFYHVYAGAAVAAGAEPVFLPTSSETGFLPDYQAVPEEILKRTALCILCSPSNPQGAAANRRQLADLLTLARKHDFVVAFDECYAEIYTRTPPAGALDVVDQLGGSLDNLLVFHSLSKRSNAAGLRCGFAAGNEKLINALNAIMLVGGAGVPLPVMAAGTRLWRDDTHVEAIRAFYQANFEIAQQVLGNRFGFSIPDGGFFLWLDVGDGEAAAKRLWQEAGIRVLPGAYMSVADNEGYNPGAKYIRIALVFDAEVTKAALGRIAEIL
ncbi:aminotransferase class I/II-fold pyridoxal phosphate-dependent enzyme [Denitrobaculum tricleocarpae]|uniref:aminotransferase class I/II-fold pyridoxal phosphate-dependent enzyme n=1 Tax=Denitrobaculum tricleocarpae TaxID=2591009 RepID=UPI001FEB5E4B|nr:aminotransferase class I/II-fold pyridoxal phosphate-dependent enzyme [Denitrobaculum tricleocarpae]